MRTVTIAFDVDGTLISNAERKPLEPFIVPNERIRTLLLALAGFKNVKIVVWSGSGELWARQVVNAIGISKYIKESNIMAKNDDLKPDIAIDDVQDCTLGKLNLIVKEK